MESNAGKLWVGTLSQKEYKMVECQAVEGQAFMGFILGQGKRRRASRLQFAQIFSVAISFALARTMRNCRSANPTKSGARLDRRDSHNSTSAAQLSRLLLPATIELPSCQEGT